MLGSSISNRICHVSVLSDVCQAARFSLVDDDTDEANNDAC